MSKSDTGSSKKKSVIIAVSVLLAIIAAVLAIFVFSGKKDKDDADTKSTTSSFSGSTNSNVNHDPNAALEAPESDDTPQANNYTTEFDRKDGSALKEGTESDLIKGAEATNRWKATSVISDVEVERVKVSLDEYENGKKTGNKKTRYMYAAKVTTRPSRINMISANQFTPDNISGIPAIVSGFESKTGEDILFACSNELCARDGSNPNGNVYYNDENNLEATVVKNSVLAQQGKPSVSLVINENGKWEYPVRVSLSTSAELIKFGATSTVAYTYPVIWEGKKYKKNDTEISYDIWSDFKITPSGDVSKDRTLIGKIDNQNYVFLISEGFSGGYLIDYMLNDMGANYAYWGACGYATGMYVDGYGVITSNNYIAHGDLFCVK